jgi:hypothetical protein
VATADPIDPPKAVSGERLDRLYHGPLEEFTAARNALAKELGGEGEREAANWVKALRKPTRAAWLVNQLASRRRADVGRLLEHGEVLRAQQESLIGGSADSVQLREAARAERSSIDRLVKAAAGIGREHDVGAAILDRVAETLQAASSDPGVADAIKVGRLTREQRSTSLGLIGSAGSPPTSKPKRADDAAERRARSEAAKQRRAAERAATAAERRLARERAAVERAREELGEHRSRLSEAKRELAAAQRALKKIR